MLPNVTVHIGIHPSQNAPVPAAVTQPRTMTPLLPCLTEGKTQLSWYHSPGRRHTCWTPSEPNKFILVSSNHSTLCPKFLLLARFYPNVCGLSFETASEEAMQTNLMECAVYGVSTDGLPSCFFHLCSITASIHAPVF